MKTFAKLILVFTVLTLFGCPVDRSVKIVNLNDAPVYILTKEGSREIPNGESILIGDNAEISFSDLMGVSETPGQPEFEFVFSIDACRVYVPVDTSKIDDVYYNRQPGISTVLVMITDDDFLLLPSKTFNKDSSVTAEIQASGHRLDVERRCDLRD